MPASFKLRILTLRITSCVNFYFGKSCLLSESLTNTEILTALSRTRQDGGVENRDKNYFVRGQNNGEKIFLCLIWPCNIKSTRQDIRKETVPDYFKLKKMNANSCAGRNRLSFGLSSTSDVITFD